MNECKSIQLLFVVGKMSTVLVDEDDCVQWSCLCLMTIVPILCMYFTKLRT